MGYGLMPLKSIRQQIVIAIDGIEIVSWFVRMHENYIEPEKGEQT